MKKLIVIPALFACILGFAQNVKLEITDFHKTIEGKVYATYQFAQASYSYSRSSLVFVTSKESLLRLYTKIPQLYKKKQEYTDVWILGIDQFKKDSISDVDRTIIDSFLYSIIKYRADNDLPPYPIEQLRESKIFLKDDKDLFKYISCGK